MARAKVEKDIFGKEITLQTKAEAVIEIMEAGKELGRQEAHVKGIIRQIDVDKIGPNPWQPRQTVDSVKVQELADDIAVRGLLQPITVRTTPSKNGAAEFSIENPEFDFQLAWGQRRIKAVQLLLEQSRWEGGIDAQVQDLTDEEMILGSLAENNARESVDIIEETRAIHQALDDHPRTSSHRRRQDARHVEGTALIAAIAAEASGHSAGYGDRRQAGLDRGPRAGGPGPQGVRSQGCDR